MNIENNDYKIKDGVLYEVKKNLLPIPDGVTKIGPLAFDGLDYRGGVLVIPSSVVSISKTAFRNCYFDSVEIPPNVKEIGEYAFFCCHIKKVCVSDGIEKMGINPFFSFGESYIEEVEIPIRFWKNFRVIAEGIKFPELKKVNFIGEGEEIPFNALIGCKSLNEVKIPNSVKIIGIHAFAYCRSLKRLNLPDNLTIIDKGAVTECTLLEEIIIPNSVTRIGESAFNGCGSLKKVILSEGLEEIGESAFWGCTSLEEITIPESVTKLDSNAFTWCSSLKKVILSEELEEIGDSAFSYCTSLEEIIIPSSVTEIRAGCFQNCQSLKAINLPNGLIEIEYGAFINCSSLEEIYIPNSVIIVGNEAFAGCTNLKKVHLSESITLISAWMFYNCSSLEEIYIPGNIKEIGEGAFSNCTSLKRVNLSVGLTTIGSKAFENCASLEEIAIPESVTNLDPNAFTGCSLLKKISISNKCNILFDGDKVTIEYIDIDSLNINLIYAILANKESTKNIEFKSPKYSLFKKDEKKKFDEILTKDRNQSFIKDKNIKLSEVKKEEKDEDDIKHLEDEIIYLCKDFPKNIASIITEKVNEIDRVYRSSIESFKPEYGKDNGDRFDYEGLKNNTYLSLNRIKSLIKELNDFILFSKNIDGYKELINKKAESYSYNNDIESKIKNILYLSTFLDNNSDIKNTITKYLDDATSKVNNYIVDKINGNPVLEESSIIMNELDKKIDELFDSTIYKVKDVPKYKLLCLYNILNENEYKDNIKDNDIIGFISELRYLLDRLSNSEYKSKLRNDNNNIINKYKDIISSELNNNITKERYEEIEIGLRRELHPLIIEIDKYANLDKYEEHGLNIHRQLEISFDLVNGKRYLDEELNNYNHKDILIEVINIMKDIDEKKLTDEIREKVYKDINNVLMAIKNTLDETDVSSKEKYIRFMASATSMFTEVTTSINKYIKSTEKYNKSFGIK